MCAAIRLAAFPAASTLFEVVTDGHIHRVPGTRLKKWIANGRQEWKGPCGLLFKSQLLVWSRAWLPPPISTTKY